MPSQTQVTTLQYRSRGGQSFPAYLVWAMLTEPATEGRCVLLPPGDPITCSIAERAKYKTRLPGCPFCPMECPDGVLNSGQMVSLAHVAGQAEELRRPDLMSTGRAADTLEVPQKRGPALSLADYLIRLGNKWMQNRPLPKQYARRMLKFLSACRGGCVFLSCFHRAVAPARVAVEATGYRIEIADLPYTHLLTKTRRGYECQKQSPPPTQEALPPPTPEAPVSLEETVPSASAAPVAAQEEIPPSTSTESSRPPVKKGSKQLNQSKSGASKANPVVTTSSGQQPPVKVVMSEDRKLQIQQQFQQQQARKQLAQKKTPVSKQPASKAGQSKPATPQLLPVKSAPPVTPVCVEISP